MEERSGSFLPELPYTNRGVIRQKEELSALIDWCQVTIKEVPLEAVIETLYLEWEQREEHFKKPDICGKSCRLQTDCRQYEKQETPL